MVKKIKKAKRLKKKRVARVKSYMMVIRVSVPAKDVPHLKVYDVFGLDGAGYLRDLEVLNAYYDKAGQPNAMPDAEVVGDFERSSDMTK